MCNFTEDEGENEIIIVNNAKNENTEDYYAWTMLKWLVQKMPDPLKNGIGIDDDRGIKIENLTDDPLATLDFKDNDNLSAIRKSLHPSNWLTIGSSSEEYAWKEVYSVNR